MEVALSSVNNTRSDTYERAMGETRFKDSYSKFAS